MYIILVVAPLAFKDTVFKKLENMLKPSHNIIKPNWILIYVKYQDLCVYVSKYLYNRSTDMVLP